ncbi:MAG TPA: hypothetical protein VHZ76_00190, partial [Gammaproteobacteria bacterium]|nr:hypothetical protein [Gammaproteobacteria bacterium]
RAQFIRQAITHELVNFQTRIERDAIIKSFQAMKNSPDYLKETEEIDSLDASLPKEEKEWWDKEKS